MLSRIAESLFWIGRYTERAEDTARILDVHFHLLLEDPWVDEQAACAGLLEIMGVPRPGDTDAHADVTADLDASHVSRLIAFDLDNPSSIVGSLTAARENARGAREAISSEMWECLNATYNELPNQVAQAEAFGPSGFFRYVKQRAAIMAGLADATLSRDDGWRFFVLGRSLERVDMTCRLLSARFGEGAGSPGWVTLLRSCSAHEAYLRTYRRAVDASLVAEFLLLDRLFPRSVYFALALAERCLAELAPPAGRAGVDDEARRILGRARTDLEYRRVDELLRDLPTHLSTLEDACSDASTAIAGRYFRQAAPVGWTA
ncbi:MAG TPA: alpha-E domain-containing protein [Acidimicrobiales bacterium]|nr:alpha-E domain-containing protein [Acidimicrobiales bacterium]